MTSIAYVNLVSFKEKCYRYCDLGCLGLGLLGAASS